MSPIREHLPHLRPDIFPFIVAPEVIQKKETAAQVRIHEAAGLLRPQSSM